MSVLSEDFLREVRGMRRRNLAVELLEKLLKGELATRRRKNMVQARSFAEMLEQTIRRYQNRAVEAAQVIEELIGLAREMREANPRGEALGLSDDELAFYDALGVNDSAVRVLGDETLREIARELVETVRNNLTIDWTRRENVRAKLRVLVKRVLRKATRPTSRSRRPGRCWSRPRVCRLAGRRSTSVVAAWNCRRAARPGDGFDGSVCSRSQGGAHRGDDIRPIANNPLILSSLSACRGGLQSGIGIHVHRNARRSPRNGCSSTTPRPLADRTPRSAMQQEKAMDQKIPQILREIPPEKLRALIEALLGAPLHSQSAGSRHEVIENPTDEQRRQEHVGLAGNRIMLPHRREKLHFETDWTPADSVSDFALSAAQITYLGAVSESRFLSDGTEVSCTDRWKEIIGSDSGETAKKLKWPKWTGEGLEVARKVVAVAGEIVKFVRQLDPPDA